MSGWLRVFLAISLIVYLGILFKMIVLKYVHIYDVMSLINERNSGFQRNNFVPFRTILDYLFHNEVGAGIKFRNLVGNILGFIPFGFLVPLVSRRQISLYTVGIYSFLVSLSFESLQLFLRIGSFDVDDLILNTLGGLCGYWSIQLLLKVIELPNTRRKWYLASLCMTVFSGITFLSSYFW
ncbi:VanZ family protein [Halobacillus yeomjeoni]|uniref:VanZ family protein n=1 Tax=Halobacillus yeomjeoni TaxID=311194 RepID=A0A931HT85_9BACI|nr:VanZ family protein [Halobacillus yeomjeoni]MBH0229134.1 VanZ family protein [Halobacillus yeomjeoni]